MTTTTIPVAPERSNEQRLLALAEANRIRSARSQLKRDLKARRIKVSAPLAEPPEFADSMKIITLLLATPKVGRVKANKWLHQVRISPSKTLGGLSPRQRDELLVLVGGPRSVRSGGRSA